MVCFVCVLLLLFYTAIHYYIIALCLHSSLTPFTEAIYLSISILALPLLLEVAFSRSVSFKVSCFLQFNFNSCMQNVKRSFFFYQNIASMIRRGVHSSYQHHRTNGKQTNRHHFALCMMCHLHYGAIMVVAPLPSRRL